MKQIQNREDLKAYYFDQDLVSTYIGERFQRPLGRLLHTTQVDFVNAAIRDYQVQDLLEIAPGPGRVSSEIVGFQHGTMVDSSENMLKLARERLSRISTYPQWSFMQADIFEYRPAQSVDLVYSFRLIRHFADAERQKLYAQINTFLKAQGLLIFDAVNAQVSASLRQQQPEAYPVYDKLFRKAELLQELHDNGFEVLLLHSVQCHFGIQAFLNNKIPQRFDPLTYWFIKRLEDKHSPQPLEWIVLCRKISSI